MQGAMHDLLNKEPTLASSTGAPTHTKYDNRLFGLLVALTILAIGMLLIVVTALIVYLIWHRVSRHRRAEEKQKLSAVLYTRTGSHTTEGNLTTGISSADVVSEEGESARNPRNSPSTEVKATSTAPNNYSEENPESLRLQDDSLSQTPQECASITVSEEHRRNTQQFLDICSKSKCLKVPKIQHKVVQTQGAQTVDESTSSGNSQNIQRTMATCDTNSLCQLSFLRKDTESNRQHSHINKKICEKLRRIPWVEGYCLEGQSIEVYVDLQIPLKGALYILKDLTGYGDEKFIVKKCKTG